jgi:hypothetical protein
MDIYLHSPITYSIARQLQREGELRAPLVVCGRGMQWEGAFASAIDDGIWDLARTVAFLDAMVAALPDTFTPLRLRAAHRLPAGQPAQLSCGGQSVCYLEEGNTSCNPCWRRRHRMPPSMPPRCCMLQARPVLMQPGTDAASHPANQCGARHLVRRAPSEIWRRLPRLTASLSGPAQGAHGQPGTAGGLGQEQRHWLCFLPNIINKLRQHSEEAQRNLHGLMSCCAPCRRWWPASMHGW